MGKLKEKKVSVVVIFYDKKREIITTKTKLFAYKQTVGDIVSYARVERPPTAWSMEIFIN